MKYESSILKRLIEVYGVVGNPRYISEIIKQFIVKGKECYPNLFTYQADWLAHIDEFGLTPEYTVSYTGQHIYAPNTKEKPVKRAILKGSTKWTNANGDVFDTFFNPVTEFNFENGYLELDGTLTYSGGHFATQFIDITNFDGIEIGKEGAYYGKLCFYDSDKNFIQWVTKDGTTGIVKVTSIPSNAKYIRYTSITKDIFIKDNAGRDLTLPLSLLSVKMPVLTTTGKNLFDGELEDGAYDHLTGNPVDVNGEKRSKYPIRVNGNAKYYFSSDSATENVRYYMYDENMNFIATNIFFAKDGVITTVADTAYVHFRIVESDNVNIQIEHGAQVTSYEPFKSNILTVNEDVTLRSNGDICDELNLLTGQLTQRIGEDGEILTQEVVKRVDLTIHDKDHQKVERLTSFEGGTYFTTTSQDGSLLPTLTVDVVTDLEETLMVCSLEGNTI